MTFEEGEPHRTRKREAEEDDAEDVLPDGNIGPGNPGINNNAGSSPEDPKPSGDDPDNSAPTSDIPTIPANPTVPTRRSERGHVPSRRFIESEEYEGREEAARRNGEQWSTDQLANEPSPLALISQNRYAFAATSGELWVPQTYKQAMRRPDLWFTPMEREFNMLLDKDCWELVHSQERNPSK
ncbi:uncharacterized protein C8R40DRAFT_1171847 [Lentinula edodes]|uniref:uncharacterized protein n=1 Tax=Lentinula edodes TaxID=5353 RepID=UPI001E8D5540|nr:uncharacterized protein C8R40DRAFT_1171847 [Lentinula edodes]KAH7873928.1 hypothetical protein C8R40DRAFT_1171847 [Lentinula edodes]